MIEPNTQFNNISVSSPHPRGWNLVKLLDVCEIIKGKKPALFDINDNGTLLPYLTAEFIRYSSPPKWCLPFDKNSILVNKDEIVIIADGSNSGEVFCDCEGVLASTMGKLRILNNVHTDFLYFFIKLNFKELNTPKLGAAIPHLDKSVFYNLSLPLPSLAEQRRISHTLRERLLTVSVARKAAEERLLAIQTLPSAFLRKFFPKHGDSLPDGWKWVKLEEVVNRVDYGYTASANFNISSPKLLRITDIQNGTVNWDNVPGCRLDNSEIKDYSLNNGDIVFARTGATTGKSFQVIDPPADSIFASYLIRVQVNQEVVLSDYLYCYFQSDGYWRLINDGARGGALVGFNATMLKALIVPIPNLDEQNRISSFVKGRMAHTQLAIRAAEEELRAINALPEAILRKAFNGEI